MGNELQDLESDIVETGFVFHYDPRARLPLTGGGVAGGPEAGRRTVALAARQLLHPDAVADGFVRRGQLRVSEFLPDGREVTRAVLQSGACFTVRRTDDADSPPCPAAGGHDLARTVLMALEETEIWTLPAGALAERWNENERQT